MDWQKAELPILPYRSEFCQRLEHERMLVVTAETGSGKSTQLPQYAAKHFGSLVVCTQPRVLATLSLARRVAEEYDGRSVGGSVGYKVGNANEIAGTDIMFMTDAALIRESQRDPTLKHIRVLIIDEAHERSLNTDIVIGIAKILLAQRPNDFYVVIASATIDPARFLQFFDRTTSATLEVEGRVFFVTLDSQPPPSQCTEQNLIEEHIVPALIQLYPRHEGHTLVFLPGQVEIEQAVRAFKSKLPDTNCIALPLYGSQSLEDQEKVIKFNEKGKRMVVFCTNIAETSLTIPDVRLVIDSGWAKEARFDVKRRLTIIETVRISRSSADQRKGRAGRTAPGHCVRLYEDAELKRLNIEPEIVRSSLDLVLLQLIQLNLDPNTFPFMDQPKSDVINNSLDLLTRLECIDDRKVTRKGELFTGLGLDPRLSAFIVEIYTEYGSLLEITTGIVAVLSAPGTIFFIGGATKQAKQEAKNRVATQAQHYKSDLFHLYAVYDGWKNARTKETEGECSGCKKPVIRCTCRVKYSNDNGLNNKILQIIDDSYRSIIRQIKNARWLKAGTEMAQNTMDIIGIRLAQLFPEQHGYLLVPKLPTKGVQLVSTNIRASISETSVFIQKLHTDSNNELYHHFVAMSITQLPSGKLIVEKLHPIPKTSAAVESPIQSLMTIENISYEISRHIEERLKTYQSQPWGKRLVYQYDRPHCRSVIWGPSADKSKIISIGESVRNEILKNFSDKYELLECGPIKASFQSGLLCTHINTMNNALRLDLQNVPNQTSNELKYWLKKIIDIEWDDIEEHTFYTTKVETSKKTNNDQSTRLCLTFKNEDAFQRATNKVPPQYLSEQGNNFKIRRDNEKETWGRELVIQTSVNVTAQNIIDRYGADVVINCIQLNKQNDKSHRESSLKLNNLPLTSEETFLRECLQKAGGPTPTHVHVESTNNDACGCAKITFKNEEQRNRAAIIYELNLCQSSFLISCREKTGIKQKLVETKLEKCDDVDTAQTHSHPLAQNHFRITLISREATLQIFSSSTKTTKSLAAATSISTLFNTFKWTVDSSATITILRTDLYPDLKQIVDRICDKFSVQVEITDVSDCNKRCTFNHGSPQMTSLAASMLAKNFACMKIKLNTNRQKQLFIELEEVGELQKWANELRLASKNKHNAIIKIQGPQIAQGQLMRRIADYSDDFDKRFREYELNASIAPFFGLRKAASNKLQQIASRYTSKLCLVSFISRTSTIVINGKPKVLMADMNDCENDVMQLLNEMTTTMHDEENDDNDGEESIGAVRQGHPCVFCKQESSNSTSFFRICGHAYCRCAAQTLSTCNSFPLQCKDCKTNIHISDVQFIFSNNEELFLNLLKSSIQGYLTTNVQQDDRTFCPNDECNGLIKFSRNYQTCLTCGRSVCSKCQVIDDELHVDRTCVQLAEEKKRRKFLPQLFIAAKKFVQDNWPIDTQMQPIGRIDENPYLAKQYKSLARFYEGSKTLGHSFPPDLAKGFFAYHGSSSQAILPICQNGFDPKRRSGQAYGRGEYFGVTANISHGYSQKEGSQSGFSQIIITFILRCTQITTKENFCYVVDNPIDWKYAFNLPVLIVTYGQASISHTSPFPNTIADYADDDSPWNAPFRWHWREDNGRFEPYNDTINEILEKCYEQWKLHGGSSVVVTPPLIRYLDDTPQPYQIDYKNNRQINMKTLYPRPIERRPIDNPPDNQNWFYRNEHGNWVGYESLVQTEIETAFKLYRAQQGSSTVDIQFPGRPETYQINFLKGQQTNKTTNAVKDIKRK
jgi:HrpA-like RNA helicase